MTVLMCVVRFTLSIFASGQCLKAKSEEKQTLENELKNLANQSISLIPGKNGELRDAVGTGSGPQLGNSLSWDFEGLNVTDDKTRESDELLVRVYSVIYGGYYKSCDRNGANDMKFHAFATKQNTTTHSEHLIHSDEYVLIQS